MSTQDKRLALELIDEAIAKGARQRQACEVLELTSRTVRRWRKQLRETGTLADSRQSAAHSRTPANKLTEQEKQQITQRSWFCNTGSKTSR